MKRTSKTAIIVAAALLSSHFLMDAYKIGIKDGKATKAMIAKEQKDRK